MADADLRREIAGLLPNLRGFARLLVRDRTMADDVVQDTLVRALAALYTKAWGRRVKTCGVRCFDPAAYW